MTDFLGNLQMRWNKQRILSPTFGQTARQQKFWIFDNNVINGGLLVGDYKAINRLRIEQTSAIGSRDVRCLLIYPITLIPDVSSGNVRDFSLILVTSRRHHKSGCPQASGFISFISVDNFVIISNTFLYSISLSQNIFVVQLLPRNIV